MVSSKLSRLQHDFVDAFFGEPSSFFLTGGGALAGYHLGHRCSSTTVTGGCAATVGDFSRCTDRRLEVFALRASQTCGEAVATLNLMGPPDSPCDGVFGCFPIGPGPDR